MSKIALIAALDENGLIGNQNALPWPRLRADMRHFRETTLNHPVVMGRKTFESLGSKPLPSRTNIILTRDTSFSAPNCEIVHSVEEVLTRPEEKIFIIGGREVYQLFLPHANQLYLTYISGQFTGDTYFPEFNKQEWELSSEKEIPADTETPYPLRFTVWERI
jgi:dihydrofolate reductase